VNAVVDPAGSETVETGADERVVAALLAKGRLKDADLARARRLQEETGGSLLTLLARLGLVSERDHAETCAEVLDLPLVSIKDAADLSVASDKPLTVLYIGDRDPSGMHMSEIDLPDRIARYGGDLTIVRVAIDDQDTRVESNVPHFMAKDKRNDPRYHWFVENYGHNCWELDALSPAILRNRLEAEIVLRLDREAWSHMQDIEATERESTRKFVAGYAASISGHASK